MGIESDHKMGLVWGREGTGTPSRKEGVSKEAGASISVAWGVTKSPGKWSLALGRQRGSASVTSGRGWWWPYALWSGES